jgi:hypothetical protein
MHRHILKQSFTQVFDRTEVSMHIDAYKYTHTYRGAFKQTAEDEPMDDSDLDALVV